MPRQLIWTTRDGEKIPIRQLGDVHLVHIVKLMVRNFRQFHDSNMDHLQMLDQMVSVHTMSSELLERDIQTLFDSTPGDYIPLFDALVNELRRRKLITDREMDTYKAGYLPHSRNKSLLGG